MIREIQDGKIAGDNGKSFELTDHGWLGHKGHVGAMTSNNSDIDTVVFNHEIDGFADIKAVEAELSELPQFKWHDQQH